MESTNLSRLATLSHPHRMAVLRLLVRRYPDAVPAGEIRDALNIKASTLSVYLSTLLADQLVTQTRHATSLHYQVRMDALREVSDFLFLDCCRGRPEMCTPFTPESRPIRDRIYNVLFVCTGNSARSICAEAILRATAGDRFNAYSAGTAPNSDVNPYVIALLAQKGLDTSQLRSKTIAEFQNPDAPVFDFVFTVCDRAANEDCPTWSGQPISAHWGLPDPVKTHGSDAEQQLAFQQTYGMLKARIGGFTALPFDTLDRISLQAAVDTLALTKDI
jgi:protein-tyrosine-phosphatase/DNA-binding transcriptional ArsR family regulator